MKAKTKKRNRAAQDVNLINLRALKKRVEFLEQQMTGLLTCLKHSASVFSERIVLK